MKLVNRTALVIRPQQPFIDWANGLENNVDFAEDQQAFSDDCHVYLIDDVEDADHLERILRKVFPIIFEEELYGWWTDESDWPQNRDFRTFRRWFKVEWHTMLFDLGKRPLHHEEL